MEEREVEQTKKEAEERIKEAWSSSDIEKKQINLDTMWYERASEINGK